MYHMDTLLNKKPMLWCQWCCHHLGKVMPTTSETPLQCFMLWMLWGNAEFTRAKESINFQKNTWVEEPKKNHQWRNKGKEANSHAKDRRVWAKFNNFLAKMIFQLLLIMKLIWMEMHVAWWLYLTSMQTDTEKKIVSHTVLFTALSFQFWIQQLHI